MHRRPQSAALYALLLDASIQFMQLRDFRRRDWLSICFDRGKSSPPGTTGIPPV
jgi:hypothetical protein